mgnify:FL=1
MANTREIKLRIKGVNETKKITKAMKLIAAVKLRKARAMHDSTLPFFKHIQETMVDILERVPDMEVEYFDRREDKENRKIAYLVITSDSGLTGGYNINMIKYAEASIKNKENDIVFAIGNTGKNALKSKGFNVRTEFGCDDYNIDTKTAGEIATYMLKLFREGEIDEVVLLYTEMESAMKLQPHAIRLLPLEQQDFERKEGENKLNEELEFEPSPKEVFDVLTNKYMKGVMYGGMVEAFVSENLSRMNAMDSATSNAEKLVDKLTLNYNRARQAAITQEISEIISGANNV